MEILTAYVREHAPGPPKSLKDAPPPQAHPSSKGDPATAQEQPPPKLATDIQAILTVLGRRTRTYGNGEQQRLNLTNTDLRGAILTQAQLQGANLHRSQLQGATLSAAQLQGANLQLAHPQGTILNQAQLQGAKNLRVEQLAMVKTLYQAQFDPPLLEQIQQQYPQLLEKPQ